MNKKMNKKGKIIHWLNFALIVIVVYVLISQAGPTLQVKGSWQTGLIKDTYLEAQKDLLQQDIIVKGIGRYSVKQLAPNGGFFPNTNSSCGITDNKFQLWNKLEKECFPNYKKNAIVLGEVILKEKIPSNKFSNVIFKDTLFSAKGNKKNINTDNARYFYDTSFAVDLGYDLKEYDQLKLKSQKLLSLCRNKREYVSCIQKPVLWHYGSCENEQQLNAQNRVIEFCVEGISSRLPLNYYFALDFTPTSPFEVENVGIKYDQNTNTYEISFDYDEFTSSYNVYFTNALNLVPYQGKSSEIQVLKSLGEFLEKVTVNQQGIINDSSKCNNKEKNKAYFCNGKIFYILGNQLFIPNEEYFFTVTSNILNQESELNGFLLSTN